jgi:hypothetical protein
MTKTWLALSSYLCEIHLLQAFCDYKSTGYLRMGEIQQLAWHARGHRFDSDILHIDYQVFTKNRKAFFVCDKTVIKHKRVLNYKRFHR